ncbi:YbfA family protein [Erwiniaceae bacterium BAC15a-03b]|uniref:YbfA family protein n=1 Tax=Winslowiella arboricola TaxID=2978220 RepID=A0A9J6PK95_9GAMM|nr:YbfA family protein [Winslowiella arboricola]MCU5774168.1 YbfA family protein [Winslowiella arboricola]MCU5776899.1 YbfA family protein [Winslowiella arboricola]
MYQNYSLLKIILRRTAAIMIGLLALPVMLFREDRARFYSYLHRYWSKTSTQPVWLAQSEAAGGDFW